MASRDLVAWSWQKPGCPSRSASSGRDTNPPLSLHREANRCSTTSFAASTCLQRTDATHCCLPHVKLVETDKEICGTAEFPGLDEKKKDIVI